MDEFRITCDCGSVLVLECEEGQEAELFCYDCKHTAMHTWEELSEMESKDNKIKTFRLECGCGNVLYIDANKGDDKILIMCSECGHMEAMSYDYLEEMENGGFWP